MVPEDVCSQPGGWQAVEGDESGLWGGICRTKWWDWFPGLVQHPTPPPLRCSLLRANRTKGNLVKGNGALGSWWFIPQRSHHGGSYWNELTWRGLLGPRESGWPCLPLCPQSLHRGRSGPSVLPIAGLSENWPKWVGRGTARPKPHPSLQGWDAEMDLGSHCGGTVLLGEQHGQSSAERMTYRSQRREKGFAVESVAGRAEIWVCIEISTLTMTPRVGLQAHHCNLSEHHLLPVPLFLKYASAFLLQGYLSLDWGPSLHPRWPHLEIPELITSAKTC